MYVKLSLHKTVVYEVHGIIMSKNNVYILIKNTLLLKNATHNLSLQQVMVVTGSQITIMDITMKKFEISWELPKCDTEIWSEQVLLEKWQW